MRIYTFFPSRTFFRAAAKLRPDVVIIYSSTTNMETRKSAFGQKMIRLSVLTALLGTGFAIQAQNLVPNPGFENAICPTGYNGMPTQVAMYMQDWYSATCASPDVMTNCSVNTGQAVNTSVPDVWFGYQYARTGNNYMGLGFYGGWYEYLGVRLSQPLTAGTTYHVSFYASCANDAKYATDALGIYFSDTEVKCTGGFSGPVLTYVPQVVQTAGAFLNDTLGWQQVSGSFTATGGEEYLVVGYFNPWNVANFQTLSGSAGRCYYYLDDFSVEAAVPAPAQPGTINGLQAVCENTVQTFSVAAVPGATSYTWTLPGGWTGSSATNSITATVGNTSGTVTVTADNTSGSSAPQTLAVTVNPFPAQPGTITGPAVVCAGSTVTYSLSAVAGADTYFWTLPAGWSGGSSTTSITVVTGNTGGMLTGSAQNGCGTSGTQIPVTVSIPDVTVTQTGNQLFAANTSQTYQWADCHAGYAELPGETQPAFTAAQSGSYAVVANLNGCTDTSVCYTVTIAPTGIGKNITTGWSVYPNPAREFLQLTLPAVTGTEITFALNDLTGKTVWQGNTKLTQTQAALTLPATLATGLYRLEVRDGNTVYTAKLLIEN